MRRRMLWGVFSLVLSGFIVQSSMAQVPGIINYQGRVAVNGTNFNGTGQFKFALINELTNTLWSNNGSGTGGGEPTAAVTLTVSKGLYSVLLGDATLPNMTAISTTVFTNAQVWLRVWFNDGVLGFQKLVPDQRIAAVGYAMQAAGMNAAGLVGTVPDANLSANIARLDGTNQVFSGATVFSNVTGNFSGTFSGNGAAVSNVDLLTANARGAITWTTNWGNFVLNVSPGVGNGVQSVAAADVNGDGKLDLISADYGANTLSVLTNNGNGSFTLSSSPGVGSGPQSVVAADVNGDGKVDLISANYSANTLSVLTNSGSGSFTLSSSPAVGVQPLSVAAADVNGDGKLDLISANFLVSTLSVLTNSGTGGFTLSSSPGVGNHPVSVAAADVNADGKVDLISANLDGNTLSVLTNSGSGGFALSSSPAVGNHPYSVAAADVNGDGKVDLINANYSDNTLSVLVNAGSGSFTLSSSPAVGSLPCSVAAADVNGDSRIDLISANSGANTLSVLFNTPSFRGSFSGDGSGLTGLMLAKQTQSGTVDVSDLLSGDFGPIEQMVPFAQSFTTVPMVTATPAASAPVEAGSLNVAVKNVTTSNFTLQIAVAVPRRFVQNGDSRSVHPGPILADGNPAFVYTEGNQLKFIRAADGYGSNWLGQAVTITAGTNACLASIDGKPSIAFFRKADNKTCFIQAADAQGASWNPPTVLPDSDNIWPRALAEIAGTPGILFDNGAYYAGTDSKGTNWTGPFQTGLNTLSGGVLIMSGSEYPAVAAKSYAGAGSRVLVFARANNTQGSIWGTPVVVDTNVDVGGISMALGSGKTPVISYMSRRALRCIRATSDEGTSWGSSVVVDSDAGESVSDNGTCLTMMNDHMAIVYVQQYGDEAYHSLKYVQSNDPEGLDWTPPVTIEKDTDPVTLSMINQAGRPVIGYLTWNNGLVFLSPAGASHLSVNWIASEP